MKNKSDNSRLPILLSAAICPGAGQFYQRRWMAGTLYLSIFIAAMLTLFYNVLQPLIHNYEAVMNWTPDHMNEDLQPVRWRAILIPFATAMMTYLVNLVDVALAQVRRKRTLARLRLSDLRENPHPSPLPLRGRGS